MVKLELGKLFKEGITRYSEGVKFDINDGGANLIIRFNRPTNKEVEEITKGEVQYGYYKENNVILMLFKFGSLDWLDSPYFVELSNYLTNIKEVAEGQGLAVNIYIVDAATGVLEGMRLIGLSTRISKLLKEDIEKQRNTSLQEFDFNLNNIYRKYQTKDLVKLAKVKGKN